MNQRMSRTSLPLLLCAIAQFCGTDAMAKEFPTPELPKIPEKTFNIVDFGANSDGQTDSTEAVKKAIAAAKEAGGGIVRVPAGRFVTGPFALVSNLNLHLDKDARLLLINDVATYPKDEKTYADWITAKNAHDIAITGEGTFDGQGQPWWDVYRKRNGVVPKGLLHRPQMFRLDNVTRLLVKDVYLVNSPNFHLIPQRCSDVTIDHITIKSPHDAPNTDGIDPSGYNYHIKNCTVDTGDDNVVLKPQASREPGRPACENFLVEDCTFLHGHGMSIGGQTPGGARNLVVRNCTFDGTDAGIRLKAPRGDGGLVEDLTYENLTMKNVKVPIYFTSYYPSIPKDLESEKPQLVTPTTPIWRNIHVSNVTVTDSPEAGRILGLPEMPIENVTFTNVKISAEKGLRVVNAKGIKFVDSTITPAKGPAVTTFNAEVTGAPATPAK